MHKIKSKISFAQTMKASCGRRNRTRNGIKAFQKKTAAFKQPEEEHNQERLGLAGIKGA